jgi:hypothetical protein
MLYTFIACQIFVVLFIALHDWIPLGKLNNLAGIRAVDSLAKRVIVTALSALPYAICLAGSIYYASTPFPGWLDWCFWLSYGIGLYGLLRAWYIPYLLSPDPARAARYQQRYAQTHAFLPARYGIRPDTLHVGFHAVYLVLVALLVKITLAG